ncbi:MAG: RNA polymerase sigma factor [Spirochaetes bacterium]|nr:RNA polymerase sigma factor [Spirochaetota bacterium]
MYNPFTEIIDDSDSDDRLIRSVLEGDSCALEKLIYRHQAWIYNIALKMVFDPDDAEDVTQEILLKIISHLSAYESARAPFRTWLYRIVANHVLGMKKRKIETAMTRVYLDEEFPMDQDAIEDRRPASRPDHTVLVEETRNMCLTGMLLCLERRQRLAFILGGMFGIPSSVGSEILDVTEANYRALLSRARKKIENFVMQKCGLVNPENPCRCEGHVKKLISSGWIDRDNPRLTRERLDKISSIAVSRAASVDGDLNSLYLLFRDSPFYESPDMAVRIREILGRDEFGDFFTVQ